MPEKQQAAVALFTGVAPWVAAIAGLICAERLANQTLAALVVYPTWLMAPGVALYWGIRAWRCPGCGAADRVAAGLGIFSALAAWVVGCSVAVIAWSLSGYLGR